jgi:hypothetical protein
VPETSPRPTMLIVSFSQIYRDPRVIKQVRHFAEKYAVVTCGFGQRPPGVTEHIEVPATERNKLNGRYITLRAYRSAYARQQGVRYARQALRGRRFDVALANDIDAVPVALAARPVHGVLADMHEYFPLWREENALWKRRISPYYAWLCRRYLPRARHVTTVSGGLAREYERLTGRPVEVVTNATPYHELSPRPVGERIRVVHSGASLRRRHLELVIEAVGRHPDRLELDLYVVPSDPTYHAEMVELAGEYSNVTIHDPVPYDRLITTLNDYDVGVHVIPGVSFNNRWALPNKFFDYVQARLAIAIGPSPEMMELVHDHGLGLIAEDFTVDAVEAVLAGLDRDQVTRFKAAADAVAHPLGADVEIAKWDARIAEMLLS